MRSAIEEMNVEELDSLLPVKKLENKIKYDVCFNRPNNFRPKEIKFDDQSLLDVGTGAGFPGIPLKIVFEDLFVTLLEPTLKRVNFLDIVIKELGLKKIVTINKRAEDYVKDARSYYDLVTARAVSRLNMLLELCMPLVKVDGLFLAMKGSKGEEEIQESINALKILKDGFVLGIFPNELKAEIKKILNNGGD